MKKILTIATFALISSQSFAGADALSCFGTEPFWAISTKGQTLSFEWAGEKASKYTIKSVGPAAGTGEDYATLISAVNANKETLKLIVQKTECNDGMSDKVYSYSASVVMGDSLLIGCCN